MDRPILTGFGVWRVLFVGLALLAYTLWAFFWMKGQGASDGLAHPDDSRVEHRAGDRTAGPQDCRRAGTKRRRGWNFGCGRDVKNSKSFR